MSNNFYRYKIRFHLARGKHYQHWQIRDMKTKEVHYIAPEACRINLLDCKLISNRSIAEKIYDGANKSVCGWILCRDCMVNMRSRYDWVADDLLIYNPRYQPYWTDLAGNCLDGAEYDSLELIGKEVIKC